MLNKNNSKFLKKLQDLIAITAAAGVIAAVPAFSDFNGAATVKAAAQKTVVGSQVKPQYTNAFNVEYLKNGCKVVTDAEKRKLLLVPRGNKVPDGYKNMPVIYTPIKNVIAASMTQVSMMRPLREIGSITGVTNPKSDWYISDVVNGIDNGKIKFVGDAYTPDYEKIKALKPELVFVYTGQYGQQSLIKKLEELHINYAVDNEYLDSNPLGRLEWVKFISAFYNKENVANKFFDTSVKTVQKVGNIIKGHKKVNVLWGSIYQNNVYIPEGGSYIAKMINMAGGNNIFKDVNTKGDGSTALSLEDFYQKGLGADVFMYSSVSNYAGSLNDILKQGPILKDLPSVKANNMYYYQPWYFQSVDKTADMVKDLAAIFYPSLFKGYKVQNYLKVPAK